MPFPAAPTLNAGVVYDKPTTAMVPDGLRIRLYDKKIIDWLADLYPSSSVVMRDNKKIKEAPKWSRWERKPYPNWIQANAAITAADVDWSTAGDFSTAHLARIKHFELWQVVRTREVVRMAGALSTTPYSTVTRGIGNIPAQALVVGDKLVRLATAFPEGSTAPAAYSVQEEEVLFYATEHSMTVEATSHILAQRFELEGNRRKSMTESTRIRFTEAMKRSFFSSAKSTATGATGGVNTVEGLINHCQTWTYNVGGLLTRPDFFGFVGDGPGRYIQGDIGIAMSSFGLNIVNNWLADVSQNDKASGVDQSLGFNVSNLKLVAGRRAKLFYEAWLDEDPTTQGWFFVFPLNKMQGSSYIEVRGPEWDGRTQLRQNIKTEDGYKGKKDEWYAFYGWEHGPEIGYGFGYGIEG